MDKKEYLMEIALDWVEMLSVNIHWILYMTLTKLKRPYKHGINENHSKLRSGSFEII